MESRGTGLAHVDDDGGLAGPFNAMVVSPIVGRQVAALGAAVRFSSSLDERLLELAIIAIGAHWRSNFEWFIHSELARNAGIQDAVIEAIAADQEPAFANVDEEIVYSFSLELITNGRVRSDTYREAIQLLGQQRVVDLVTTVGFYSLISLTLNAFEVAVPEGNQPSMARRRVEVSNPAAKPKSVAQLETMASAHSGDEGGYPGAGRY